MTDDDKAFVKKTSNCIDEYADAFGYSSLGDGADRIGSIAFFKHVSQWPADGGTEVVNVKHNLATIRMPEELMLKLASFIIDQHDRSMRGNSSDE